MTCPNKNHPDWIALVDKIGESNAYIEYTKNGLEIPDPSNYTELEDKSSSTLEELFPNFQEYRYITNEELSELEKEREDRLKQTVINFLKANDISYEEVSRISVKDAPELTPKAIADMVTKSVRVLQGQESPEILGEEAGHFLVELLGENNPLYQSMYDEIVEYNVYKEVQEQYGALSSYKGQEKRLRKEAMAKLIGQIIAGDINEVPKKEERVGRWWNRVLRYLKEKVKGLLGIESIENIIVENDPFSEAAQIILSERRLENTDFRPEDDYFLSADIQKQNEVVNNILNKHKVTKKDNTYYLVKDGVETKIDKRVTDRVKAWSSTIFSERGEMQKKIDELKAKYGTAGHQDIQNIIDRAIARREGTIEPARQHFLPDPLYNLLERHFNKFIESFPEDAKFITEATLYDPNQKEAGTVDLIVVYNDGSASIYDWKFIDFGRKKEIAWYKEQGFNIQLPRYKEILRKEYGVERIRQTRVIPISARYKAGKLEGLQMADTNINNIPESEEYLRPLPIHEEMTGDEGLDRIITSLLEEKKKIQNNRINPSAPVSEIDAFRAKKAYELKRIHKAIRDIQVKHDLTEYVDRGLQLIKDLNASNISSISSQELLDLINTKLKFYSDELITIIDKLDIEKTKELKENVKTLQTNAKTFEGRILSELTARAIEKYGEEITEPQKEKGIWTKMFRTISQQNDPIIASFWDLVKRSQDKTRREYEALASRVDASIEELRKQFPGKLGNSLYDFMLNEGKNGSLNIIGKYSSDFYQKLDNYRSVLREPSSTKEQKAKAREWLRANTKFDEEGFRKRREVFKAAMERAYKEYSNSAQLVAERIKEYDDKWSNNDYGLSNPRNRNITIVDNPNNYSDKYKVIANNKAMKNFYDLWMEMSSQFQDYVGIDRNRNFVWNVPNSLFESIMQNGISSIVNKNVLLERFYSRESEELGMIDEFGKPLMQIPVYYSKQNMVQDENGEWRVDSKNQSRDLGSVLLAVGAMAYNHKNMSDIETDSHLLYTVMASRGTIPTSARGKVLRDKFTGTVQKIVGASSDLEQFRDYIDHYLYGKNLKHGDVVFTKGKQNYSGLAVWNFVSKTITGKALAFNPISIVANAVAGDFNARMVGRSRMFFNNKDYSNALFNLIPARDRKTHSIIGFFDLVDGDNYKHKSNNRNINWLTRKLTYDNLFIGQKAGDWMIRNGVLIGMAKKYKVENGKIVRVAKNEDSPSLFDYLDTNGSELNLKDLDQVELDRFRDKVNAISNNILGNTTQDDIRLINMSVGGRALMMFRSWLPRTFDSRYGELRYNAELETYELGRYKTFWNQVINKQWFPLIGEMIASTGVFGFGGKVGRTTIERAKQLWADAVEKDPTLKITQEEYIELHVGNLRMMMAEIYTLLAVISMVMLIAPDDDETLEQGSLRKYLYIQSQRIQTEIMTYWNPVEFDNMLRNPIPATRLFSDAKNFVVSMVETPYLAATGQRDLIKPGDFRKYSFKMIPGLSGFEQIWSFIDENYDKTQAQINKSK